MAIQNTIHALVWTFHHASGESTFPWIEVLSST
jgi:hypothetical protein